MPILSQDMASQMRAALDAEGADYYKDGRDIIPAINNALRWLESLVNRALGEKKLGEEIFQDLSVSGVFRTSKDSRISIEDFPTTVWSILAVYAKPETGSNGNPTPVMPFDRKSYFRSDLYHISPTESGAKRLNLEEWADNKGNPFEAGYVGGAFCENLIQRAYLNPVSYNSDIHVTPLVTINVRKEIEVRPPLDKQLVTIFWAKSLTPITALTDYIEFPSQVFQIILNKALQYISYKQGDQTNLYSITEQDIQLLISAIQ